MPPVSVRNQGERDAETPDFTNPSHTTTTLDSAMPTVGPAGVSPPPRRDPIDLVLAFFDWLGVVALPLGALALAGWLSYIGAICVTTALLRRSATAQQFFVNLLADMMWSGYSILIIIGIGLAFISIIQFTLWPRGWLWNRLSHWFGRAIIWATTVLWLTTIIVEAYLIGWGFELWATPWYIRLSAALELSPVSEGLILMSVLVAPVIAVMPEWCARYGLTRLVRIWRNGPTHARTKEQSVGQ